MAQSSVRIDVAYADAATLSTWLGKLAADAGNALITNIGLQVIPTSVGSDDGRVTGHFVLSSSTAVDDLTVEVEDPA